MLRPTRIPLLPFAILASGTALPSAAAASACQPSAYDPPSYGGEVQPIDKPHINFEYLSNVDKPPSRVARIHTCLFNRHQSEPLLVIWDKAQLYYTPFNLLQPDTDGGYPPSQIAAYTLDPDSPIEYTLASIRQPASLYLPRRGSDTDVSSSSQVPPITSIKSGLDTSIINRFNEPVDIAIDINAQLETEMTAYYAVSYYPSDIIMVLGHFPERLEMGEIEIDASAIFDVSTFGALLATEQAEWLPEELLNTVLLVFNLEGEPLEFVVSADEEMEAVTTFIAALDYDGYLLATGTASIFSPVPP